MSFSENKCRYSRYDDHDPRIEISKQSLFTKLTRYGWINDVHSFMFRLYEVTFLVHNNRTIQVQPLAFLDSLIKMIDNSF